MNTARPIPMPLTTGAEACTASDAFFLDQYPSGSSEVLAATTLCRRCPLVRLCLIWALDNPALTYDGIWGATTPAQRRELRLGLVRRLGREVLRAPCVPSTGRAWPTCPACLARSEHCPAGPLQLPARQRARP
ncbi:WhiB family transcriptional regulator [Streptomyces sp. NPDC126514]|uniref:WhiB family transcriptional regulator n=1 Tax=Streptomyces sp. NPDC126514 TaxID=3155210 RepID=UPI003332EB64